MNNQTNHLARAVAYDVQTRVPRNTFTSTDASYGITFCLIQRKDEGSKKEIAN